MGFFRESIKGAAAAAVIATAAPQNAEAGHVDWGSVIYGVGNAIVQEPNQEQHLEEAYGQLGDAILYYQGERSRIQDYYDGKRLDAQEAYDAGTISQARYEHAKKTFDDDERRDIINDVVIPLRRAYRSAGYEEADAYAAMFSSGLFTAAELAYAFR